MVLQVKPKDLKNFVARFYFVKMKRFGEVRMKCKTVSRESTTDGQCAFPEEIHVALGLTD